MNQSSATVNHSHRYVGRTGIHSILDQLFDHRSRPLNDFAGGYLIDDRVGEEVNYARHFTF